MFLLSVSFIRWILTKISQNVFFEMTKIFLGDHRVVLNFCHIMFDTIYTIINPINPNSIRNSLWTFRKWWDRIWPSSSSVFVVVELPCRITFRLEKLPNRKQKREKEKKKNGVRDWEEKKKKAKKKWNTLSWKIYFALWTPDVEFSLGKSVVFRLRHPKTVFTKSHNENPSPR